MAVQKNKNIYRTYKKNIKRYKKNPYYVIGIKKILKLSMLDLSTKETITYILVYMFFYNTALISVVAVIWSLSFDSKKTLNSLKNYINNYKKYIIFVSILSIAGVPPFIGFFFKINLISLVAKTSVFVLIFMFYFFFAALYFYIQNIRFLLTPNLKEGVSCGLSIKKIPTFFIKFLLTTAIATTFGFLFIDDIFLPFVWLMS